MHSMILRLVFKTCSYSVLLFVLEGSQGTLVFSPPNPCNNNLGATKVLYLFFVVSVDFLVRSTSNQ